MDASDFITEAARDVSRAYYLGRDVGNAMDALADALATWDGRENASTEEARERKEQGRGRLTYA